MIGDVTLVLGGYPATTSVSAAGVTITKDAPANGSIVDGSAKDSTERTCGSRHRARLCQRATRNGLTL